MIQKEWQQPTFQPKWSRSLFARRYPRGSSIIPPYLLCSQPAPCVIYSVDNTTLARDFYFVNKGPTMDILTNNQILSNLIFMIAMTILYITVSLALVRKVSWCNSWRSSPIPREQFSAQFSAEFQALEFFGEYAGVVAKRGSEFARKVKERGSWQTAGWSELELAELAKPLHDHSAARQSSQDSKEAAISISNHKIGCRYFHALLPSDSRGAGLAEMTAPTCLQMIE